MTASNCPAGSTLGRDPSSVGCLGDLLPLLLGACQSNGPRRIGPDRFDYIEALASSSNEQILLNLAAGLAPDRSELRIVDRITGAPAPGQRAGPVPRPQSGRPADRPTDAFVAVRYRGRWFFVPSDDRPSKPAFGILTYIFQLQAPKASSAGPVLTVPAG